MGVHMRNAAKRFVTLVDALYETRTKLVMSAAVQPDELYEKGDGSFEFERGKPKLGFLFFLTKTPAMCWAFA